MTRKYPVIGNGDLYLSIAGSATDGFQVHEYKKLGSNSVTYAHKTRVLSLLELVDYLKEQEIEGNDVV